MVKQTITANEMSLSITGFASDEDREAYNEMHKALHYSLNSGVVLTPIYSSEGRLMSIIVDDRQAHEEIKRHEKQKG